MAGPSDEESLSRSVISNAPRVTLHPADPNSDVALNEKTSQHNGHPVFIDSQARKRASEDDEEDEDMDALIEELESVDPDADIEEEVHELDGAHIVPEELLQTDTRLGLSEPEVVARRRKYGLNQMKEQKENLVLKFLGYFVGPIQFVMEVRFPFHQPRGHQSHTNTARSGRRNPCGRVGRLGRLRCHMRPATSERHRWFCAGIPSGLYRRGTEKGTRSQGGGPARWSAHRDRGANGRPRRYSTS